ncbi:MAG: hypothetical protein Q7S24_00090 [bacterium]|nr:hypothetical protein [bacterium]
MFKGWGLLSIVGMIILGGAGCSGTSSPLPTTSPYPTLKKEYYINAGTADNLAVPFSAWKQYTNKKYGWNFSYPETWQFREEFADNELQISLGNVLCTSQCPPEFLGFRMRIGRQIAGASFVNFVLNEIKLNNEQKIKPGGSIKAISIGGHSAFQVENSNWSGAIPGPAYYVQLDKYYYAFIAVGKNNMLAKSNDFLNKFIGAISVRPNLLARPGIKKLADGNIATDTPIELDSISEIYTNNDFRFNLIYPGHCSLKDTSQEVIAPIRLDLVVCNDRPEDKIVGMRVYRLTATDTWNLVYKKHIANWQVVNLLISDVKGKMYVLPATKTTRAERWLMLEKNGHTYVIYVLDDQGQYAKDFDALVNGLEIL